MNHPLVSIVTPVYNGEAYLAECIESVLAQTYPLWDYTIVNNCSTDGTLEIAQKYAALDSRIRIHNNSTFVAAIENHNVAFRMISPESRYAKAVFADDWIFPECIGSMVSLAEAHPSAGVVGAYGLRRNRVIWNGLAYPDAVVSGRDICRLRFLENIYVFGGPTSHLVRSDLARRHDPLYDPTNIHADTEMCIRLMRESDFGFVHQVLTYTRDRSGSLTSAAEHFHTLITGELYDLVRYGREFLTPEEFGPCLDRHLWSYYHLLATGMLQGREPAFWDHQRRELAKMGLAMEQSRLAKALLANLADLALNPKQTLEQLVSGRSVLTGRLKRLRSFWRGGRKLPTPPMVGQLANGSRQ